MKKKDHRVSERDKVMKTINPGLLKPINLDIIGGNNDPCFGKLYDLSTNECKMCGDSELCCIKTAAFLGKTRKELETQNKFKDLDDRVDRVGLKKYYRNLKRKGKTKKEIIQAMQDKYKVTLSEARTLYRDFTNN